jgi:hypothetical protein
MKSRKIVCRMNLGSANETEMEQQPGFTEVNFGGAEGIRTPYLLNAIQSLSQLSYSPNPIPNLAKNCAKGKAIERNQACLRRRQPDRAFSGKPAPS